jgi:hypothetical protein
MVKEIVSTAVQMEQQSEQSRKMPAQSFEVRLPSGFVGPISKTLFESWDEPSGTAPGCVFVGPGG